VVELILAANAGAHRRFHTGPDEVRSAIDRARRCGFAITSSGTPRHVHLGVAVRDGQGKAIAALKVLRPAAVNHWADLDRMVAALQSAMAAINGTPFFDIGRALRQSVACRGALG
jgi:DNA-binding IclR family transcriptional regulator